MTETEESTPQPANVEEAATARPESVSSSSEQDTNEDGSSTPPSVRKTRSSGPLSISSKIFESINTTRRSARRDNFLKSNESDGSRPRIGADFQADVPELLAKPEKDEPNKNIKMWTPVECWDANFNQYCDIARVCRKVSIDVALKHLLDRDYNLEKALEDFELLPISDSIQWSKEDFNLLVKKMVQNRRLNVIQKHLLEFGKSGAQVVEKRYELFHQLCYGPSHWLCPSMKNCTNEDPVVYRQDCENCSNELYKTAKDVDNERQLCNACQLYATITNKFRPFSTPINQDELIKKQLEKVEEYESDDEHYECFTQPILAERLKPVEWTIKEEEQCVQGFRKHGLNFDSVAEEMGGTKTESQIEQFYLNNRHRYCIDTIAASSEKEPTPQPPSRPRRLQDDDRTPTPTVEDASVEANVKKADEPSTSNMGSQKNAIVEAMA